MSWLNLNQSLNSLKGQITNFATEVLADGVAQISTAEEPSGTQPTNTELEEKCHTQELEIAALKKLNDELQTTLQSERLARRNGVKEDEPSWYWDPSPQAPKVSNEDVVNAYKTQLQDLQAELSNIRERESHPRGDNEEEINRLREENKNLTCSLEDLDSQHQMAMERLLTLKKELQINFEVLKKEHEDLKSANDEYAVEIKHLLHKLGERDQQIERLHSAQPEYEILHHKYQNLERVHSVLRDNAEKFQEENQDLHEEVFKLQEQVTKLEHELELANKNTENTNMVSRDKFEEVLKQLNDYKHRRDSNQVHLDEINIDDNAKGVIETLKRDISSLKHRLSRYEGNNHNNDVTINDKIKQLYNRYVNFDLPVDYVGEIPSSTDNAMILKLESIFKAANSFKTDIDMLQEKILEKNSNVSQLQLQIDELTSENEYLTTDMQHLENDLEEMKKNNDFLIAEIASLKNASKLQPIIETHEDNIVKLETELADCNEINKTFESEIKRIQEELEIVKSEKNILQDSLNDMKNKYMLMLSELETCKIETKALNELESITTITNVARQDKNHNESDNLRRQLSICNSEKEKLAIDIHIIENDKILLTKEVDDLRNALKMNTSSKKEFESTKIILDHKLKEIELKLDEVIKKKDLLEKQNIQLKEVINNQSLSASIDNNTMKTENTSLLEKCNILSEENIKLMQVKEDLTTENSLLNQKSVTDYKNVTCVQKDCEELKAKSDQIDALNKELHLLKQENRSIVEEKIKIEEQLANRNNKILTLENEAEKYISDLNEKLSEIDKLHHKVKELLTKSSESSKIIAELENNVEQKDTKINQLQNQIDNITEEFNINISNSDYISQELKQLHIENEETKKQTQSMMEEINIKNNYISQLTSKNEDLEKHYAEFKTIIDNKEREIKDLNQSIAELTKKINISENTTLPNGDYVRLQEEKNAIELALSNIQKEIMVKENDLVESLSKLQALQTKCKEHEHALDNASAEKNELINLVNLKHNESIQYHAEIQRLNHVLLEQTNEFKRLIEDKDAAIVNNKESCLHCDALRNDLKEKEARIIALNQSILEYERLKGELSNSNEIIKSLTQKCKDLDKSLEIQQDVIKNVTAENLQLSEKEQNASRELERLRHHLVELEENYTQELMTSEQKLNECQTRLQQVEERAKQTSTVYTSNSIRANQEVETLRNQIKLLEKQRDDVQSRLSEAEDTRSRSEAALTNLQIVLEQFQLDKERDIHAATEKIRRKLDEEKQQSNRLEKEISKLNIKLEESIAGLQAATRLGDQVETKSAQINDLKEQVRTLQISVAAAEERYRNAISNQQDKVDKNLVKNLVVNYVMSGQNNLNRTQVLRVLSTVLDFNQQECEKLGLIKAAAGESLAAEFVRFLQDESKPRPPQAQPSLMRLQTRAPSEASRKSSSTSSHPPVIELGHSRNPSTGSHNLLFQNLEAVETSSQRSGESEARVVPIGLLETGINQTRNNEGAILKHVLKDL